jgi:hypothetical protein
MITHSQVRSLPRIRTSGINLVKESYDIWYEKYKYKYSYKEFTGIWKLITDDLYTCIGEERDGVKLPHSLGELYLGYIPTSLENKKEHYSKISKYNPDFKPYARIIKLIYGTNHRKYIMEKADFWYFKPCRQFKNSYKEFIMSYPERYKVSQEKRRGTVTNINRFFKLLELNKQEKKGLDNLKSNLNIY